MTFSKLSLSMCLFMCALVLLCAQSHGGEASDVADYIKLLSDANPTARRLAAEALGRLGPRAKDALPALRKGLDDPEARVKAATVEALKKIEAVKKNVPLVIKGGLGGGASVITFSPDGKYIADDVTVLIEMKDSQEPQTWCRINKQTKQRTFYTVHDPVDIEKHECVRVMLTRALFWACERNEANYKKK